MAAGEDQHQPIVLTGLFGWERHTRSTLPIAQVAAQHIDRPAAGYRPQPGPGAIGDPARGPLLPGRQQRVLDDFFGGVEVAQDACYHRRPVRPETHRSSRVRALQLVALANFPVVLGEPGADLCVPAMQVFG